MKDITNMASYRLGWLLFTGVLVIVAGCSQPAELNPHEEEVLRTLEELRLAQDVRLSEIQSVDLGKKFLVDMRLAEHDATVNPAFITSAKMTVKYYMECFASKRRKDSLGEFLANPPDTSVSMKYNARHILLDSEDEALTIIQKLDQGDDFATLAHEFSTGPSGKTGGKLGWIKSPPMVKQFIEATAQLEKGGYSKEPVETQFGWHVIMLDDFQPSETQTDIIQRTESVKAQITRSRKDLDELLIVVREICGNAEAALEKTHDLRGG